MEAKLNVVVDKLAGQYQNKLGSYRPITHMYSSIPAVLEINRVETTSYIRHHLIRAYTEPIYMQYLQDIYKWTDETVQSIAWIYLNLSLRKIDREILLVKIYNNLLHNPLLNSLPLQWMCHLL